MKKRQLDYDCYCIEILIRMASDHRRNENHAVRFMSIIIGYKWYLHTVRRVRCLAVAPTQFHHFWKTFKYFVSSNERLISLHHFLLLFISFLPIWPFNARHSVKAIILRRMLNLREKKAVNLWMCNKLASKTQSFSGWTPVLWLSLFLVFFSLLSSGS